MSDDQASSAATEAAQRQVRVQLTSKQEDIALPESTGPILVPTGKNKLNPLTSELEENGPRMLISHFSQVCDVMRCQHW